MTAFDAPVEAKRYTEQRVEGLYVWEPPMHDERDGNEGQSAGYRVVTARTAELHEDFIAKRAESKYIRFYASRYYKVDVLVIFVDGKEESRTEWPEYDVEWYVYGARRVTLDDIGLYRPFDWYDVAAAEITSEDVHVHVLLREPHLMLNLVPGTYHIINTDVESAEATSTN